MNLIDKLKGGDYSGYIKEAEGLKKAFKKSFDDIQKEFIVSQHNINDPVLRPDKKVEAPVTKSDGSQKLENGVPVFEQRTEPVTRVALSYQKLIVERRIGFLLGNPVEYYPNWIDGKDSYVDKIVDVILDDNKMEYKDRDIARRLFSEREVAEVWYIREDREFWKSKEFITGKSINSPARVKVMIISPSNGDELIPVYDEFGDMISFIRKYKTTIDGKEVQAATIYTNEIIFKLVEVNGEMTEMENGKIAVPAGKIMIVYYRQENTEWEDSQNLIEQHEIVDSNLGDENLYSSRPILFTKGKITGMANKRDSGKVMEGTVDSDVKFVSNENAPESIKTEIDELKNGIFKFTQTPDLSFENVKGITNVSGRALKLLFTDAQMAARTKESIFGEGLQRRVNLLKAIVGKVIDTTLAEEASQISIKPVFTPFLPEDLKEDIETLVIAKNGGIMSTKTAIAHNSLVTDKEAEMLELDEDAKRSNESYVP